MDAKVEQDFQFSAFQYNHKLQSLWFYAEIGEAKVSAASEKRRSKVHIHFLFMAWEKTLVSWGTYWKVSFPTGEYGLFYFTWENAGRTLQLDGLEDGRPSFCQIWGAWSAADAGCVLFSIVGTGALQSVWSSVVGEPPTPWDDSLDASRRLTACIRLARDASSKLPGEDFGIVGRWTLIGKFSDFFHDL